jgi:hypothetical protein
MRKNRYPSISDVSSTTVAPAIDWRRSRISAVAPPCPPCPPLPPPPCPPAPPTPTLDEPVEAAVDELADEDEEEEASSPQAVRRRSVVAAKQGRNAREYLIPPAYTSGAAEDR